MLAHLNRFFTAISPEKMCRFLKVAWLVLKAIPSVNSGSLLRPTARAGTKRPVAKRLRNYYQVGPSRKPSLPGIWFENGQRQGQFKCQKNSVHSALGRNRLP